MGFDFCLCFEFGHWPRWLPCTKEFDVSLEGICGETGLLLWQSPTFFSCDTAIHHWDHNNSDWDWGPSYPEQCPTHTQWHSQPSCGTPWHWTWLWTWPGLESEDQNILAIESTNTLDNLIDNSDPTFDIHNSSISDCADSKQTIDNSDIGDPDESKTETIDDNIQDTKQNPMPKKVIKTEAPKNDMMTVNLITQDTQLNPNQIQCLRRLWHQKYRFTRIKKSGKVQKIQSPRTHKMKFKPSHRNKRIYGSKQLCHVNNVSHDGNSSASHNFYHMVTSNINGLHTVTYPQNLWLLKRPRVKIK